MVDAAEVVAEVVEVLVEEQLVEAVVMVVASCGHRHMAYKLGVGLVQVGTYVEEGNSREMDHPLEGIP